MEFSSLIVALAALILLAVTSLRYGVDSREGWPGTERMARRAGTGVLGAPAPRGMSVARPRRLAAPPRSSAEPAPAPCAS